MMAAFIRKAPASEREIERLLSREARAAIIPIAISGYCPVETGAREL
jgi:hypothetical protein